MHQLGGLVFNLHICLHEGGARDVQRVTQYQEPPTVPGLPSVAQNPRSFITMGTRLMSSTQKALLIPSDAGLRHCIYSQVAW